MLVWGVVAFFIPLFFAGNTRLDDFRARKRLLSFVFISIAAIYITCLLYKFEIRCNEEEIRYSHLFSQTVVRVDRVTRVEIYHYQVWKRTGYEQHCDIRILHQDGLAMEMSQTENFVKDFITYLDDHFSHKMHHARQEAMAYGPNNNLHLV